MLAATVQSVITMYIQTLLPVLQLHCSAQAGQTYYSACVAGCLTTTNNSSAFTDCACAPGVSLQSGYCSHDCQVEQKINVVLVECLWLLGCLRLRCRAH